MTGTREQACPFSGESPYARFASLGELHDLQFPSSDSPLELQFMLITQVKELLFRMLMSNSTWREAGCETTT